MRKKAGILAIFLLASLPAAVTAQPTIRVNAGGPAYLDSKGQSWSADYGFNSGTTSNSAKYATVTGTTDPTLFKSARVGLASGTQLQYQFAVANGTYKINLYLAETYYSSAGQRVFDVQMQGATVFSALDVFAQAGLNRALVKSAQVSVTNGQLVIQFVRRVNVPVVSALEILPAGTTVAPPLVSITAPANGATVSGTTSVSGTASSSLSISSVQLQVDSGSFSNASGTNNWSFSLNTVSLSNGTHTLTAKATDGAGGTALSKAVSVTVNNPSGPTVTINWSDVHQQIDGFGAADVFNGWGITDSQADLFWSTTNGVGLSLLRIQVQSDGTYPDLATLQKAQSRGVKIWAAPWSPPASMKTNQTTTNGGYLLTADYQAYANYLAGYVSTLKTSYGIDLYALSIQNEPDWTAATWDSCIWTGSWLHTFIGSNLHPALAAKGLTTKIILPEQAGWNFDLATATLSDSVTAAEVSIVAGHDYNGGAAAPYPLAQNQGKHLWQSEISSFEAFDPSISNGLRWAQHINDWMTIANANAWHYWDLVPDVSDTVNVALLGTSGQTTKRLFVMGNFSKFVRPGYYRIGTSASPVSNVSLSAYKDLGTGKFAIVAINHNSSAVTLHFSLNGFTANRVTPWVTSATLDLVAQPSIAVGGSVFGATLPPASVTTFVGP